jgi:hypothetical protein
MVSLREPHTPEAQFPRRPLLETVQKFSADVKRRPIRRYNEAWESSFCSLMAQKRLAKIPLAIF